MPFSTATFLSFPLISYPHPGLFSSKHFKRIQLLCAVSSISGILSGPGQMAIKEGNQYTCIALPHNQEKNLVMSQNLQADPSTMSGPPAVKRAFSDLGPRVAPSAKVSLNMTICILYQAVVVQLATSRMLHESGLTVSRSVYQRRWIWIFEKPALVCPAYARKSSSITVIFAIVVLPSHKLGAPCEAGRAVAPTGINGIPTRQAPLGAAASSICFTIAAMMFSSS